MAKIQIRYFVAKARKGGHRYYWQPARSLRQAGWFTRRLSDALDVAISEAENFNRQLDAWRSGAEAPIKPGTLPWLMRLYRTDERFEGLAPATKRGYE